MHQDPGESPFLGLCINWERMMGTDIEITDEIPEQTHLFSSGLAPGL